MSRRELLTTFFGWLVQTLSGLSPLLLASPVRAANQASDPSWRLKKAEWKQRLSAAAFEVLRNEATERPFSSKLYGEKRAGTYICAGCRLPLLAAAAAAATAGCPLAGLLAA